VATDVLASRLAWAVPAGRREPTPVVCQREILDEKEEVVMATTAAAIRTLAEPVLAAAGLQLWDVEVARDVVRILVERDGGVDLEVLTAASQAVSELFDEHDDLVPEERYQLEISSPGLERTLRTPEQYRRYLHTTVTVKTVVAIAGARRHRGVLAAVLADRIELLTEAAPKGPSLELAFDQIERTLTVVDWGLALKSASRPTTAPERSDAAVAPVGASRPRRAARDTKDHS
jgi:ribosome maturation factor RimP